MKKRKSSQSRQTFPRVNLFLVGFMATGKSTVGRAVASRFDYQFLDTDTEIESKTGMTIPQIFEEEGEERFRRYERELIESGLPESGCVVACGGGLVTRPGMIELLREKGVVITLFATPETILKRAAGNPNRPLLNVDDPERRIRELMAEREPYYRAAGTMILTDNRGMSELVNHISRIYRREVMGLVRNEEDLEGEELD